MIRVLARVYNIEDDVYPVGNAARTVELAKGSSQPGMPPPEMKGYGAGTPHLHARDPLCGGCPIAPECEA